MVRLLGAGGPPLHRVRTGLEFAVSRPPRRRRHARPARGARRRARPSSSVCPTTVARRAWPARTSGGTGTGWPGELAGDAIPIASRIVQLAEYVEVAHRIGGVDGGRRAWPSGARQAVRSERSSRRSARDADEIFDGLDDVGSWDGGDRRRAGARRRALDATRVRRGAALAIADFVDLKSPYTLGHSHGGRRARRPRPARTLGLAGRRGARPLHRAGLVHDFGRLGVSNSIWDKPGPLGAGEWERVRLHPYFTERMLQQSDALAPLAPDRGAAPRAPRRLRLPTRACPAAPSRRSARILGAADAYQAMREPRPYRPALDRRRCRRRAARRRARPAASTATPSTRCSPRPATASRAAGKVPPG